MTEKYDVVKHYMRVPTLGATLKSTTGYIYLLLGGGLLINIHIAVIGVLGLGDLV